MATEHSATFFAQVKATRSRYGHADEHTGLRQITSARVVGVTQSYPRARAADTVIVKLTIRLPDAAFAPLTPAATIVVPESMVDQVVEVEALPASEQEVDTP